MEPNETVDLTQDEDLLESLEKLVEEIPQDGNGFPQLEILQEMYLVLDRKTPDIVRIFLDAIGAEEPLDIDSLPEERQTGVLEEHLLNEIERRQKKRDSGSPDSSSSDEEEGDFATSFGVQEGPDLMTSLEDEEGPEGLDRMVETRSRAEQSRRQALRDTQDAEFEASLKADKEKQEREDQKRKEEQESKTREEEASREIEKMNELPLEKKRRLAVEAFERRTKQKEQ